MELSRVCIIGNVDDGKSTLVGRLLMATQNVRTNEILAVGEGGKVDLSHFTDGLKCEQEGAFTLDVAYRHLRLGSIRVLLADAPGHIDKFQSALTALSQSQSVVIVSDIERPLSPLVRLLAQAVQLFQIQECLVAVTKMDRVSYSENQFLRREKDLRQLFQDCGFQQTLNIFPVSAVEDQNISTRPKQMPWFSGHSVVTAITSAGVSGKNHNTCTGMILRAGSEDAATAFIRVDQGVLRLNDELELLREHGDEVNKSMRLYVNQINLGTANFAEVRGPFSGWVSFSTSLPDTLNTTFAVTESSSEFKLASDCAQRIAHPLTSIQFICEGSAKELDRLVCDGNLWIENSWIKRALTTKEVSFRQVDFLRDSGGGGSSSVLIAEGQLEGMGTLGSSAQFDRKSLGLTLVNRKDQRIIGSGMLGPHGSLQTKQEI